MRDVENSFSLMSSVKIAEEIETTVITMFDVDELGIDRAMEIALEIAWKDVNAKFTFRSTSPSSTPDGPEP